MSKPSPAAILPVSDAPFRQVVEWAPTAMVMTDEAGRIVLINALTERIFGYPREELLSEPLEKLVPERFAAKHPAYRAHYAVDPRPRPMGSGRELYGRRRDGSEFPVEIGLNPISTDQGAMVLASIVDITERLRERARLENALHEKTVLLNELHHRVKNNLQVISSLLNLQATQAGDERLRTMLSESQGRVRAMALTHQLLYERKDYTRMNFGEYLERLAQLLLSSYRENSAHIVLRQVMPETPQYLDFERAIPCGLAVNELVSNAFKHAFPNQLSGKVSIELKLEDEEFKVIVADDGVGLPDDFDLTKVSSLGLQLVPLFAEQLGGHLTVEHGQGSRFTLCFPNAPVRREAK